MTNKNLFLDSMSKLVETWDAVAELEDILKVTFEETEGFLSYPSGAAELFLHLFEIPEDSILAEFFMGTFWELVLRDTAHIDCPGNNDYDGIVLHGWAEFYDFFTVNQNNKELMKSYDY